MQRLHPPALPLTGGCPCEAVRFEVRAMPFLIFAWHCTACQRWSGSASVDSGQARRFCTDARRPKTLAPHRRPAAFESTYRFCADCGGRILGERADLPDIVTVRAGTLDDTSWVRPIAHIYLASAQAWEADFRTVRDALRRCRKTSVRERQWQELWKQIEAPVR